MFGREPHLPIDLLFGIKRPEKQSTNKYVQEMKERMEKAYELARTTADKAREKQKHHYDIKAKEVDLKEGDKVLVKVVAFDGKHKIADRWEEEPYVIIRQLNNNIPVYEVKKVNGKGRKRTLHRNLLLPVGHLPSYDTDQVKEKPKPKRLHQKQKPQAIIDQTEEDMYQSDSESDSDTIIMEVPVPQSSDHIPSDVDESVDSEEEDISIDDQGESEVDGSVQEQSASETASSIGHESDGDADSGSRDESDDNADPPLRRSARDRKPPQWLGDYVVHSVQEEHKPPWKEKVDFLKELLDSGQCRGRESEIVSAIISIMKS